DRGSTAAKAGEVLPPGIDRLLSYLGLDEKRLRLTRNEQHRTLSAWGSDRLQERPHLYSATGSGWALDRLAFDEALRKEVTERGIPIHLANAKKFREAPEGWQLNGSHRDSGLAFSLRCRFIIDASGRASRFARKFSGSERVDDQLVANWRLFVSDPAKKSLLPATTLIEAAEDGWWYAADLPDRTLATAFFTTPDILKQLNAKESVSWMTALKKTRHMRERLQSLHPLDHPSIFLAQASCLHQSHGSKWAACGDAAFTADPLSSIGISMALLTVPTARKSKGNLTNIGNNGQPSTSRKPVGRPALFGSAGIRLSIRLIICMRPDI
ncbi:MAG: tryptophan 7-halogenase, partial [Roseibium sp.]|uniref:tryptophan 7-halogenase n=1 Tax=Roseibium sp. TaxID=1936156 RepID=UPI00260608A1